MQKIKRKLFVTDEIKNISIFVFQITTKLCKV